MIAICEAFQSSPIKMQRRVFTSERYLHGPIAMDPLIICAMWVVVGSHLWNAGAMIRETSVSLKY